MGGSFGTRAGLGAREGEELGREGMGDRRGSRGISDFLPKKCVVFSLVFDSQHGFTAKQPISCQYMPIFAKIHGLADH